MHRFKSSIIVFALLCIVAVSATRTAAVTIQPNEAASKDTFIYAFTGFGDLSDNNFDGGGFETVLGASYTTGYASSVSHDAAALIQFDLSTVSIPPSSIQSATLNLWVVPSSFGSTPSLVSPVALEVAAVGGTWAEGTVSFDTRPALYDSGDVGSDPDLFGTGTATGAGQWVSIDVTSLVQSWVGGSITNNGLAVLESAVSSPPQAAWFAAASDADPSLRPFLEVTVPEPASLALFGAAAAALLMSRRRRGGGRSVTRVTEC